MYIIHERGIGWKYHPISRPYFGIFCIAISTNTPPKTLRFVGGFAPHRRLRPQTLVSFRLNLPTQLVIEYHWLTFSGYWYLLFQKLEMNIWLYEKLNINEFFSIRFRTLRMFWDKKIGHFWKRGGRSAYRFLGQGPTDIHNPISLGFLEIGKNGESVVEKY